MTAVRIRVVRRIQKTETVEVEFPLYLHLSETVGREWWVTERRIDEGGRMVSFTVRNEGASDESYEAEVEQLNFETTLGEYLGGTPSTALDFERARANFMNRLAAATSPPT